MKKGRLSALFYLAFNHLCNSLNLSTNAACSAFQSIMVVSLVGEISIGHIFIQSI